jgi:WD40 repeat protein
MKSAFAILLLCQVLARAGGPPPRPVPRALAFAPDGRTLAVGCAAGKAGELALWDVAARKPLWRIEQPGAVRGLAWTPDGQELFVGAGPALVVIDPASGKSRRTLGQHGKGITALALAADGRTAVTGGADGTVKLWDVPGGKELRTITAHRSAIGSLAFDPAGKRLLSTGWEQEARLWELASGKMLRKFGQGPFVVSAGLFTPDGKWVLTGCYDGTARLRDAETGTVRARFRGLGGLDGMLFHPGTHTLVVWGWRLLGTFDLDLRPPDAATKRRIAALLAKLDEDSYAIREAASRELPGLGWVAEPALRKAAKESPSAEVRIRARAALEALAGSPRRTLRGHTGNLRAACFANDGRLIASGGDDGVVRLWDPEGREVAVLGR